MRGSDILHRLEEGAKVEEMVEEAIKNRALLNELFNGLSSSNPKVKFGSAKALRSLSEKDPAALYADWEFFVKLLDSENNILKWNAIDVVANLTIVDSHSKFDGLFKKFYGYLYKGSLITAGHVVDNSGTIALAKPDLQDKITKELLRVEHVPLPTEECRNILIGKTITALDAYHAKLKDKDEIISFVKRQLKNSRRATKVKAERLLKKLEKQQTK